MPVRVRFVPIVLTLRRNSVWALHLMARLSKSQIEAIKANPIENELDSFRETFKSAYPDANAEEPLASFERFVADSGKCRIQPCSTWLTNAVGKPLALNLIGTLLNLPAASALRSEDEQIPLSRDIASLYATLSSNQMEFKHTAQLVKVSITQVEETKIWTAVLDLIARIKPIYHPTTPPQTSASSTPSFQQTPWSFSTGSFTDTSDLRKHVDPILKNELESNLIINHSELFDAFFGEIPRLSEMAAAVLERCKEAGTQLYKEDVGWIEWPEDCEESRVLNWLRQHINHFTQFADEQGFQPPTRRRCFTTPHKPIPGSISKRKLDVGIMYNRRNETLASKAAPGDANDDLPGNWSDILVPGELKSNPLEDTRSSTWFDLCRYAREMVSAQDTRRSVIGFTLCGSIMRLWEIDRLGGIASRPFNIHKDGLTFVSAILGFLWMTEKELGFDPTIHKNDSGKYIEIRPNHQLEQHYLDKVIKRQHCMAGRATTCWRAYRDKDKLSSPFAVKDSWEYEERPEEGLLLKKVTEAGVQNVAEYYYHETVYDGGAIVDVRNNLRKGLRDEDGKYAFRGGSEPLGGLSISEAPIAEELTSRGGGGSRTVTRKRSSSSRPKMQTPNPKRSCLDSPVEKDKTRPWRNRVHRRLIMNRVGKSIYDASSPAAMLTGVLGGIKGQSSLVEFRPLLTVLGHESLLERKVLHRDISVGNVMLDEAEEDGFLIDLDLAIEIDREEASGALSKTGTKVFMAIGVLYGEDHSFIHDLESFFWVLFWVCVHWNGPSQARSKSEYESWNYESTKGLAQKKKGTVDEEDKFNKEVNDSFTPYCRPLIPCIQELRRVVFPGGKRFLNEDRGLYSRMKSVLEKARNQLAAATKQ